MNAGDRHLSPAEERWVEERNTAYSRSRGLGVALLLVVGGILVVLVVTAIVIASAVGSAATPDVEILDVDPGTATALADTGVDPALAFLAAILLTLGGLIAWGLHRKAAR